jgi:hypothetical protein
MGFVIADFEQSSAVYLGGNMFVSIISILELHFEWTSPRPPGAWQRLAIICERL